jgi:hypothetical protein
MRPLQLVLGIFLLASLNSCFLLGDLNCVSIGGAVPTFLTLAARSAVPGSSVMVNLKEDFMGGGCQAPVSYRLLASNNISATDIELTPAMPTVNMVLNIATDAALGERTVQLLRVGKIVYPLGYEFKLNVVAP